MNFCIEQGENAALFFRKIFREFGVKFCIEQGENAALFFFFRKKKNSGVRSEILHRTRGKCCPFCFEKLLHPLDVDKFSEKFLGKNSWARIFGEDFFGKTFGGNFSGEEF